MILVLPPVASAPLAVHFYETFAATTVSLCVLSPLSAGSHALVAPQHSSKVSRKQYAISEDIAYHNPVVKCVTTTVFSMGKFSNGGKPSKFTKESFEALRKKKIETARYKKHKMLKKYENLCKSEGITSSNRVKLDHSEAVTGDEDGERKPKAVAPKEKPFAKEMQTAAQRRAEIESKRQEAEKHRQEIEDLRREREKKADRYKRRKQGNRGLGHLAVDLLAKLEKS